MSEPTEPSHTIPVDTVLANGDRISMEVTYTPGPAEDDRLTCEQCGRKFYPAFYDPAVITVSPVWCNACLWAGDEEDDL